jgi:hypothetical protein
VIDLGKIPNAKDPKAKERRLKSQKEDRWRWTLDEFGDVNFLGFGSWPLMFFPDD